MRKKTGIPYMAHVMSVCALALENGADEDVAIAALLHDAVEDSEDGEATHQVIDEQFGDRVARIVMACSDAVAVPGKPKPDWRERKETYLRQLADEADSDVLLVSACDKVHNARSIVTDLRTDGDAVWQRFTVTDPHAQLWYYTSVARDPPAPPAGTADRRARRTSSRRSPLASPDPRSTVRLPRRRL